MAITVEELREFLATVTAAVYEAHRDGHIGIPAGHIYAAVMHKMSLDTFNNGIALLVKEGFLVRDASHMLRPGPTTLDAFK